jgi:ankyrin repeat protein
MARNEKLDENIEAFLTRHGLDADDPRQTEENLTFHVLESLGALYQVAIQNHADSEESEMDEAKRRTLASALRYFADNIRQPPSADAREPYPQKWLKESFPDADKLADSRKWLPLQWSINSTHAESDMLVIDDIELFCNDYASKVAENPANALAVSPLSMAVARPEPSLDVVKAIIGIFPDAAKVADKDLAFPFMYAAAWNNSTDIVQHLLSLHPGSIDKADIYGFKPLHFAAYVGSTDMVTFLLRLAPKAAKHANQYGVLPLNACVVNSRCGLEMVQAMHTAYPAAAAIADSNGLIPLHKAAQHASLEVVTVRAVLGW